MLVTGQFQLILLLAFTGAGLLISILSLLEPHVKWIARFCALFGEGCRKTAQFTLLRIPIAWWGIGFYCALLLAILVARPLVFWLAMAGFGVELTFLWIMLTLRVFCIFCVFNAFAVTLVFLTALEPGMLWQAATVILFSFVSTNFLLTRENEMGAPQGQEKPAPDVLAEVGDSEITAAEISGPLTQKIYSLESEIYDLKRSRLDKVIRNRLLQKDAERKNISVHQLIKTILSEREPVTDEEVDRYFKMNPDRLESWDGSREELHSQLRTFLQKKKNTAKIRRYADSLRQEFDVQIYLEEPSLPHSPIHVEKNPAWGPEDSPVLVVEFSDYLCPACSSAHETTRLIRQQYEDKIHWVFKDFPLPMHPGARDLAHAARCASEQGRFWEYQDFLFRMEEKPDHDTLLHFAEDLGMDVDKFSRCLDSGKYYLLIDSDIQEGQEAGVTATPSFFINGKILKGAPSVKGFKTRIEEELKKTRPLPEKASSS